MPLLFWAPGAMSLLVVATRPLPERIRSHVVRAICMAGAGLGLALFLERRSGDAWRTTVIDPAAAALAGIATAAAWVIAAVLAVEEDRWRAASLVGPGATSLVLFGQTQWAVPALLFWSLSSLAVGCLAIGAHRRAELWLGVVLPDLLFAAGMIGHLVDADSWRMPTPAPDQAFWFLLAAAVLRAGAVPRLGIWRSLGTPAAPALPLLLGGGFILATGAASRPEPWVTVGLLVVALAQAAWGATERRLVPASFAGWPSAACLALLYAAPEAGALAGSAAILTGATLAVWPLASGRAQPERGLTLTLAPLTAAFGSLVFAAERSFQLATTVDSVSRRVPWTVAAALTPLVMVAGAILGARAGRERNEGLTRPWAVGATRLFVAAGLALGLVPGALELPDDVVGSQRSFLSLLLLALAAGAVAGWLWSLRHPDHGRSPAPEPAATAIGPPTSAETAALRAVSGTSLMDRLLMVTALGLACATFAAVGWITYEGLSRGFL